MFYCVSVGKLFVAGSSVVVAGGGATTAYCYQDVIVEFLDSYKSSDNSQNNNSPSQKTNNLSPEFQEKLKEAQEKQEMVSDAEKKLVDAGIEKEEVEKVIDVLETQIASTKIDVANWTKLEQELSDELSKLNATKTSKDNEVQEKKQLYEQQLKKVQELKGKVNGLISSAKEKQRALNQANETKDMAEKEFEKASEELAACEKVLAQLDKSIQQISAKQQAKQKEEDAKSSEDTQNKTNIANKVSAIQNKITENISRLTTEMQQIDIAVQKLQQEVIQLQNNIGDFDKKILALNTDAQYMHETINDTDEQNVKEQKNTQNDQKDRSKNQESQRLNNLKKTEQIKLDGKKEEKTHKENEKPPKQTLKTKLESMQSNSDFEPTTFTSIACDEVIKQEVNALKALQDTQAASGKALKVLQDENAGLKDREKKEKERRDTVTANKQTLLIAKNSKEQLKTQKTEDYTTAKQSDDAATGAFKDSEITLKREELDLIQKQASYMESEKEQQKIVSDIASVSNKHTGLQKKKTQAETTLQTEEEEKKKKDQELEIKNKAIADQEKAIQVQKQQQDLFCKQRDKHISGCSGMKPSQRLE